MRRVGHEGPLSGEGASSRSSMPLKDSASRRTSSFLVWHPRREIAAVDALGEASVILRIGFVVKLASSHPAAAARSRVIRPTIRKVSLNPSRARSTGAKG